ncbi:hypothetical protein [Clostridium sartagoforme]|uniref:hypothetical protein n=1 Tax=Clostridium sartagoforme TaxID=84031 RepID=UPI0003A43A83|nr:hypothetical protein [Clostridium sartagoforme]
MIHIDSADITRIFKTSSGNKMNLPLFSIGKGSYINSMEISKGPEDEVISKLSRFSPS